MPPLSLFRSCDLTAPFSSCSVTLSARTALRMCGPWPTPADIWNLCT